MKRPRFVSVLIPAAVTSLLVYVEMHYLQILGRLGFQFVMPSSNTVDLAPGVATSKLPPGLIIGQHVVETLLGLSIAWLLCALIDVLLWQFLVERRTGQAAPRLLVVLIRLIVFLLAIGIVMAYVFDQPLTGVLVSSGMVGVVVGFALQRTINDFFSGIALNLEKPFRIGDWIEVEDVAGRVVEINWRATRLVTLEDVMVVLPNSFVSERRLWNYSQPLKYFRTEMKIALEYGVALEDGKRVLLGGIRAAEGVLERPSPDVVVDEFGNDGVIYRMRYYVASYARINEIKDRVAQSVSRHLWQAGMGVPYPKRDVYFAQMPLREINRRKDRTALLGRIDLFGALSGEELAELEKGMHERRFAAGGEVVKQGDAGSTLFVVVDGLLEVIVERDGKRRKVAQLEPGQFFGEMSLLTGEQRTASIVSVTGSTLYELGREVMMPVLQKRPEFAETLSKALAERQTQTQHRLKEMEGSREIAERRNLAADFLKRIHSFFGLIQDDDEQESHDATKSQ